MWLHPRWQGMPKISHNLPGMRQSMRLPGRAEKSGTVSYQASLKRFCVLDISSLVFDDTLKMRVQLCELTTFSLFRSPEM